MMTAGDLGLGVDALRNLALGVPLVAVMLACLARNAEGSLRARVPGAALGTLWAGAAVLAIEQFQTWWTFAPAPAPVLGMPAEVALGWALTWGALPALAGGRWWLWLLALGWLDVLLMPALEPLVVLRSDWWWGEALLLAVAAAPAVAIGHLTFTRTRLWVRIWIQGTLMVGVVVWLVPTQVLQAEGLSWADTVDHPYPVRALLLTALVAVAVPTLSAVAELARADGTPFPWDPPSRLVTTGPYAYLSNPMQCGMTAVLLLLALAGGSVMLALATGFAFLFSSVLADRHERFGLGRRWPEYAQYRRHVRPWLPRWRPYVPTPATLWVSGTCTLCTATGATLAQMQPRALTLRAAEDAPVPPERMTWQDAHLLDTGVAAFARSLERTTLVWAWLGWCIRLPGFAPVLQLIADACGLGPRDLTSRPAAPASPPEPRRGSR